MFGELALSERAIASQGVVFLGTESLSGDFTATTTPTVVFSGSLTLIGTSSKASAAAGFLVGAVSGSINFTKTTNGSLIAHGSQDYISSFDQTSLGTRIQLSPASLEAAFTQTSQGQQWRRPSGLRLQLRLPTQRSQQPALG